MSWERVTTAFFVLTVFCTATRAHIEAEWVLQPCEAIKCPADHSFFRLTINAEPKQYWWPREIPDSIHEFGPKAPFSSHIEFVDMGSIENVIGDLPDGIQVFERTGSEPVGMIDGIDLEMMGDPNIPNLIIAATEGEMIPGPQELATVSVLVPNNTAEMLYIGFGYDESEAPVGNLGVLSVPEPHFGAYWIALATLLAIARRRRAQLA